MLIMHYMPMISPREELEREIFDPTGQGVEVVDAEFARNILRQKIALEITLREVTDKMQRAARERVDRGQVDEDAMFSQALADALGKECETLREIFHEILKVVEPSVACGPRASIDFLKSIPQKLEDKLRVVRGGGMTERANCFPGCGDEDDDAVWVLNNVRREVEEFFEHPDCTLVDAIRLLKCRLWELEAGAQRESIYKKWR